MSPTRSKAEPSAELHGHHLGCDELWEISHLGVMNSLADIHLLWWGMEKNCSMTLLEKGSEELQELQQNENSLFFLQELTLM